MTPAVQTLITACEWSTSYFLVVSGNVFSPLLYYSYFGSVIPSIIIAFFVFFKGPKKLANRLLLLMVLSFTAWVFCNLVTWATEFPSYTMFSWSLLILFEPLVYFFAFYFVYVFIFQKDFSTIQKIFFSLPLLPTFILTPTIFGLLGYDISNCDRAANEGILATYGYAMEVIYIFLILGFVFYFINKNKDSVERKKAILLTTGIVLFLLSFSAGNMLEVFTDNWYIGQYFLFGAPVFVGFLAYIMVKYKTFNTKIFGAQALVIAIGVLIVSMFFVRYIENIRYVIIGTLILFFPFGYQLVRSVKREIAQREKIEKLATELEKSNSALEKANSSLGDANIRLQELDKLKSEFVSLATHQIRGPLSAIKGYLSEVFEGDFGTVSDELKKPLQIVFQSTENLVHIVGDFLNISRIEQGTMKYELSPFDLKGVVQDLMKELKPNIDRAGLDLQFDAPKGNYEVYADIGKITQVVGNLVDNSLKYTPKGSIKISLSSNEETQKILLAIKDTGIGIAPDVLPKLFQKFTRAEGANDVNIIGTGLGLYVAKMMIEGQQGRVWAESAGLGKGSQFYVELPVAHVS